MSRYHQAARLATGEMTEVDPEEWPIHKEVADALGGELRPFDQYQGPYVAWEGMRIFIGPPESMWMALVLGEGWVGGFVSEEEAVKQAQEALDSRSVEHDVSDFVRPDSAEGYVAATDTVSGESTAVYPVNTPSVGRLLAVDIRNEMMGSAAGPPAEDAG